MGQRVPLARLAGHFAEVTTLEVPVARGEPDMVLLGRRSITPSAATADPCGRRP